MARTALNAPAHRILQRSALGNVSNAPDSAPNLDYGGANFLDPRMPYNQFNGLGSGTMAAAVGWLGLDDVTVLDFTAPAATTANIAALQNVTSGTAMTLVTSSGSGVIVTSSALTTMPFGTVIPSGTLAMGSQMGYLFVGTRDITAYYDPTKAWACVIQVTGSASSTGGNIIIRGFDVYGQPMAETIAAPAGASSVNGKKAWKWITSATPQFSDAHNYSIGTTVITGLNLAADAAGYCTFWLSGTGYTANPSITVADTTSPATGTTGDVRGTTTLTAARYILSVNPSAARLTTSPLAQGLFGVTNFTQ